MSISTTTVVVTREIQVRTCACSLLEANVPDASVLPKRHRAFVTDGTLRTGCEATTQSAFAPGHDARLAGLLQSAARAGIEVTLGTETGPATEVAARVLSPALAAKVAYVPVERKSGREVTVRLVTDGKVATATTAGRLDGRGRFTDEAGTTHQAGTFILA